MIRWKIGRCYFFFFSCIRTHLVTEKRKNAQFFLVCGGFCANTVDVNKNLLICCVRYSLMCPIYTHIVFCSE